MSEGWNAFSHGGAAAGVSQWEIVELDVAETHVVPVGDSVEHVTDPTCECRPDVLHVELLGGGGGLRFIHRASDGRGAYMNSSIRRF